jgi:predicted alpha/beta hydrolase
MSEPIAKRPLSAGGGSRRAGRPRPRPPAAGAEVVMLAMSSGVRLAVEIGEPRTKARGTAILLHSTMASRRVLDWRGEGLASTLREAGLRTLALDFRGHGESTRAPRKAGGFGYDELAREDIAEVCRAARERWPADPVTIVGHSLGGHAAVASVSTGACEPDALVVMATNVWLPRDEENPVLYAKKASVVGACRAITRIFGHFPARALGVGSDDEGTRFMRSWTGWWERDAWTSEDGRVDYLEAMGRVALPVLGIASAGDPLYCTPACAARFLQRLSSARTTFELVRRGDDGGPPPGHMQLLTSHAAISAWRRVAEFCLARVPSGA